MSDSNEVEKNGEIVSFWKKRVKSNPNNPPSSPQSCHFSKSTVTVQKILTKIWIRCVLNIVFSALSGAFLRNFRWFKSVFILRYSKTQVIVMRFLLGYQLFPLFTHVWRYIMVFQKPPSKIIITNNWTDVDKNYLKVSIVSLITYLVYNDKALFCIL